MFRRYRLLTPDNGSNPSSATPQAGNAGDPQPQAGNTPPEPQAGDGNEPFSLEEAKKLRNEAANLRKREKEALAQLKVYQDKEQQAKDAQVPELDRWQKQATDLQAKYDADTSTLTAQIVDYEVRLKAAELGIPQQSLKHVAKLIWDDLEFDQDTGMPTNVESLLKDLLKEIDLTGKRTASAGGATNPSRAQSNASGELSWDVITKMTAEQYNARRAEIQQWMMRNPMRRI